MGWHVTIWSVLLLTTSLICFALAGFVLLRLSNRDRLLTAAFLGLSASAGVWALTYGMQLSATTVGDKLYWNRFVWIGALTLMVSWPVFVLIYTGHEDWARGWRLAGLCALPATILLIVWTGHATTYLYLDPTVETAGNVQILSFRPGTLLLVTLAYSYAISLATYALLGKMVIERRGHIRRQASILLLAGIIPTIVGIVGNTGVLVPGQLDVTPAAFIVTAPMIAWALYRHRLLDISPIARDVLFADLPDGVVVVDSNQTIVDANDAATDWFGQDIVGTNLDTILPEPLDIEENISTATKGQTLRNPMPDTDGGVYQTNVDTTDGNRVFEVSVSEFADTRFGGRVLLFRDVTDRENLQRRFRALIGKSPNVIVTIDDTWSITYAAPSIMRILGYHVDDVAGQNFLEYVHPDDIDTFTEQVSLEEMLTADEPDPVVIEHRFQHLDGRMFEFETTIQPLFDREFVITATDVTSQRQYEQRLQVLNRVLRHDLKNDMNIVSGYAELVREHVDAEVEAHLDTIQRKAERMTKLSERAREIDIALHVEDRFITVDLTAAMRDACDQLRSTFPDTQVEFNGPETADAQVHQLYQSAIDNVLENAVEHNDQDTAIVKVAVQRTPEHVEITVIDNGPGIPGQIREVFETGEETSLEHSSGLGLWLANWIVTQSGGDIVYEEDEPRGSIVRFTFPRDGEEEIGQLEGTESPSERS